MLFANERAYEFCGGLARPLRKDYFIIKRKLFAVSAVFLFGPLRYFWEVLMLNFIKKICFPEFFSNLSDTKKIAYISIAVAVSIALNIFSIDITPSNKISFVLTFAFICGSAFGGPISFLILFVGDFLSFFILPYGIYNVFIGIGTGTMGLICGFISTNVKFRFKGGLALKAVISFIICFIVCTCLINSYAQYLYVVEFIWKGEFKKTFVIYMFGRVAFQSINSLINLVVAIVLSYSLSKISFLGLEFEDLSVKAKANNRDDSTTKSIEKNLNKV